MSKKALKALLKKFNRKALKLWKIRVKERAELKCELCGVTGKGLNVHHIESYLTHKAFRYEVRNGACLCPRCHRFGKKSFHRSFVVPWHYLTMNRQLDLDYLYDHFNDEVIINVDYLTKKVEELKIGVL